MYSELEYQLVKHEKNYVTGLYDEPNFCAHNILAAESKIITEKENILKVE
jgi:hypothetical protein